MELAYMFLKIWECVMKGNSHRVNNMEKGRLSSKEAKSLSTREDGSLGLNTGREDILLVEISTITENGWMTREMGLEYIPSLEEFTTDRGAKEGVKERAVLSLRVALSLREASKTTNS